VFAGIGLFVLVMGGIYWATAYEEGGTVMLILAGVLSLWIGAFLWLQVRKSPYGRGGEPGEDVATAARPGASETVAEAAVASQPPPGVAAQPTAPSAEPATAHPGTAAEPATAHAGTPSAEPATAHAAGPSAEPRYLPHASAWPLAMGLGAATIANGLVLGVWVIVPGVLLFAVGVGGFVRQTRHRD
jgi:predicted lipid-binding transport protein (Tim44 family)